VGPEVTPRIAAAAQILLGVLLLPLSTIFGLTPTPVLALGPLWIVALGCRMWWRGADHRTAARRTAGVSLVVGVAAIAYGVVALRAAGRSAAAGGGLLGAFGLVPLVLGLAISCLAGISLASSGRGQ